MKSPDSQGKDTKRPCPKCKQQSDDMVRTYCRPCHNENARDTYHRHKEKRRKTKKLWRMTERGKQLTKEGVTRYRENNPVKHKARQRLRNEVQKGTIQKLPCEVCANPESQGHHYFGYEGEHWKDVKWLCIDHHNDVHNLEKVYYAKH